MTKTRIGVIGLGVMGGAMARLLAARYPVIGYDPDSERLSTLEALSSVPGVPAAPAEPTRLSSFTAASSVTAVAAASDVVILSLPTTDVVEAVIAGDDGLLNAMRPGSTVIDMSTTEPDTTRRLATLLSEREVTLIDAPVSGGQKGAEEGTLSVMCGGDPDMVEQVRPILETVGASVVRVGPVGSGGVAKLVNNMIVGAAFTSITEGLALSATAGIELRDLHAAIRGGWAGSAVLDVTIDAVSRGDYRPGGTVNLLSKDLGYARNLARHNHIPVPVTAAVDEVFTAAIARGDGEKAQPVIVQMWEELLGIKISGGEV